MTYEVVAERDGRWWVFTIPEIDMVGQARNLAEVESEAKNIIAMALEFNADLAESSIDPDSIDVHVTSVASEHAIAEWQAAEADEADARAAQSRAAQRRRAAVRELRDQRYTADDVGRVLGVSRQRVQQLSKG